MQSFNKLIILFLTILSTGTAYEPVTQKSKNLNNLAAKQTAISPEIINELKDFENLIPTAIVDEIVAKHYVVDGNFRTALKYLRSEEFTQLQKQLLNVPEITDILEFLHLTTTNTTTRHMGGTKATLDDYNDDEDDVADAHNRANKMTTNTGTIISKPDTESMTVENLKGILSNKNMYKRPQQQFPIAEGSNNNNKESVGIVADDAIKANSIARLSNELVPLLRIVLLEDLEVGAKVYNENHHNYHHKHYRQRNNNYHQHGSVGTFTTFVDEILEHLPNSAYQNMINDKCKKNAQFAEFYKALRSVEFKPLIEQAMTTANIKKIMRTLNSHDVDVKSLEPIAFKVISWGPNI